MNKIHYVLLRLLNPYLLLLRLLLRRPRYRLLPRGLRLLPRRLLNLHRPLRRRRRRPFLLNLYFLCRLLRNPNLLRLRLLLKPYLLRRLLLLLLLNL